LPAFVLGAAWAPQLARMEAGIYTPLYLVLLVGGEHAIYYLSGDLQDERMFIVRNPLSSTAKKAGWQGFRYDVRAVADRFVRIA
jgi:hypothetical protein